MVDIPTDRVASALHVETADLPTGHAEDITMAEHVIGTHVEPHATDDQSDAVETTAVLVAAAFISGTEGDAPVSQVDRETGTVSFDVSNLSAEARDHWARAVMVDPTNQLQAAMDGETPTAFWAHSLGSQADHLRD